MQHQQLQSTAAINSYNQRAIAAERASPWTRRAPLRSPQCTNQHSYNQQSKAVRQKLTVDASRASAIALLMSSATA